MEMQINSLQATIILMEVEGHAEVGSVWEKLEKTLCWKGKQGNMNLEQNKQERFDFFVKYISLARNTTDDISECFVYL